MALSPIGFLILLALAPPNSENAVNGLSVSKAILCSGIEGYRDYQELPNREVVPGPKLRFYYEPTGYEVETKNNEFQIQLRQEAVLRRVGVKKPVKLDLKPIEKVWKTPSPPGPIWLETTIETKGLTPGDYLLELTIRDLKHSDNQARQTVPFTIVPPRKSSPKPDNR